MSLTSFSFFVFLLVTAGVYYLCPKFQKYILFIANIFFYVSVSPIDIKEIICLPLFVMLITYFGAWGIDKSQGKIRRIVLFVCVLSLTSLLVVTKYLYNLCMNFSRIFAAPSDFSWLNFGAIIGISYFVLSAIGYLVDVYWGQYKPEKDIIHISNFLFYFPQIISGPVTRYSHMGKQFSEPHYYDGERITNGIRRMLWGYFQKLVISERFVIVVNAVYGGYQSYSATEIVFATLCYVIRLYTDFSGCMDIVIGASEIFGIELPENFRGPLHSKTFQEFWQRWHITLGNWFKDYVMYPMQKTSLMVNLGKKAKKIFGKKFGKKIPFYVSLLLLWLLLGIWHGGTLYYFLATGALPFLFLMVGDLLFPLSQNITKRFNVNTECSSWKIFQSIRTVFVVGFCWIFICAESAVGAFNIIGHMFLNPIMYVSLGDVISGFGLGIEDVMIMLVSVLLLLYTDKKKYEGSSIHLVMDEQNAFVKWLVIYLEVLCIFMYGMVGTSTFIYFQF